MRSQSLLPAPRSGRENSTGRTGLVNEVDQRVTGAFERESTMRHVPVKIDPLSAAQVDSSKFLPPELTLSVVAQPNYGGRPEVPFVAVQDALIVLVDLDRRERESWPL